MRKLFLIVISFIFFCNISFAITYNSDPKIFVTELVGDAVKILSDKSINKEDKAKSIKKIALENVDIKALGMYTLGDVRKNLDQSILKEYDKLFEKYFLKSLTSRLTDYSSNKFEVLGAEQKSAKYTIVQSKIMANNDQPEIKIDWRIYTKDPDNLLIRDLIIEGLSLVRTQREEFNSIIQSNEGDINFLFKNLRNFIK